MESEHPDIVFEEGSVFPSEILGVRLFGGTGLVFEIDRLIQQDWRCKSFTTDDNRIEVVATTGSLDLHSSWQRLADRLYSRRDSVVSHAERPLTLRKCHYVLSLSYPKWELEWQASAWCAENQPKRLTLRSEGKGSSRPGKVLHHPNGRTTEGANPYLVVGDRNGNRLSLHVVPEGNWETGILPANFSLEDSSDPSRTIHWDNLYISAGTDETDFQWILNPGETFTFPEILFGADEPEAIHAAWRDRKPIRGLPVVFNTWFDCFDKIDPQDLRKQLATASRIGCETFVVDAGWFGEGEGWWDQVGDWRESQSRAFKGQLKEFSDEVRKTGMAFGLWMEPERFGRASPIRKEHPEWFPNQDQPFTRIDLSQRPAYDWLFGEMKRLIDTYSLGWMKIDFNFELGKDASGHVLTDYFRAWYRLINELEKAYPNTVFEACSSGALRLDLKVMERFPIGFLSDNVSPWDCLSIAQGAWKRLPPGRLGRWSVLRHRNGVTEACTGAGWEHPAPCSPEFSVATALLGALGFSGDLASLPEDQLDTLATLVSVFKDRRGQICEAEGSLLTEPRVIGDKKGWAAMQLHLAGWNLVGAYRLEDADPTFTFHPKRLDREKTYRIHDLLGPFKARLTGEHILDKGIEVNLEKPNSAALLEIREA